MTAVHAALKQTEVSETSNLHSNTLRPLSVLNQHGAIFLYSIDPRQTLYGGTQSASRLNPLQDAQKIHNHLNSFHLHTNQGLDCRKA